MRPTSLYGYYIYIYGDNVHTAGAFLYGQWCMCYLLNQLKLYHYLSTSVTTFKANQTPQFITNCACSGAVIALHMYVVQICCL